MTLIWRLCFNASLVFFLVGCGVGGSKLCDDHREAVCSPHGFVPFGQGARSPDGARYAQEIEPEDHGNIGIFDVRSHELLVQIDALIGDNNDLKGLAWSPDGRLLAVMYHWGDGPSISVYRTDSGERIGPFNIIPYDNDPQYRPYYHYMVFSDDGRYINVSINGNKVNARFAVTVEQ